MEINFHVWKLFSIYGFFFPYMDFFSMYGIFFHGWKCFFHGFSESTLYLDWTLPGCSELPPKVSEFANLCFCGSWQSLISSGKKPARTHKNKNLPTLTPLGGSSDHPGSVQSWYKVYSGNPWEKISIYGKQIPHVEKNFHIWKSQMYRLNEITNRMNYNLENLEILMAL